jgi:hypothetical protein
VHLSTSAEFSVRLHSRGWNPRRQLAESVGREFLAGDRIWLRFSYLLLLHIHLQCVEGQGLKHRYYESPKSLPVFLRGASGSMPNRQCTHRSSSVLKSSLRMTIVLAARMMRWMSRSRLGQREFPFALLNQSPLGVLMPRRRLVLMRHRRGRACLRRRVCRSA